MSNTLPAAFIAQFDTEVKQAYQGFARLRGTARTRDGVVGSTYRFPKMGKGIAQPHIYQADVTPMNIINSNMTATLAPYDAAEYSDMLAQAQVNFDERQQLVKAVAGALGRRLDQIQINQALIPATDNTVAIGFGGSNAMNVGKLRAMKSVMDGNGVPEEDRHIAISAPALDQLLGSTQTTSSFYNNVQALVAGELKYFLGFNFHIIENRVEGGLPLVGNIRTLFAWHKDAVGVAIGMDMRTEMNYIAQKTSWLVNGMMLAGAINIENAGIVQVTVDESVEVNPTV